MQRHRSSTTAGPGRLGNSVALIVLAMVTSVLGAGPVHAAVVSPSPTGDSSWTVYHGDLAGQGVAGQVRAVEE